MMTTVMLMLIVPILLGALNACVEPDLKEVAYFVEVCRNKTMGEDIFFCTQYTHMIVQLHVMQFL